MTQSEELFRALVYIEELLDLGEVDEAHSMCLQLRNIYPENEDLLFVYAITLQLQEKQSEAISIFKQLVQKNPTSCEIWNHYAFVLFEERKYKEAENILSHAFSLEPQHAFSWWLLCLLRTFTGQFSGAKRAYLYTQWLDPEAYPPLELLEKKQLEAILERSISTLEQEQQNYWNALLWNISDIPQAHHTDSLNISPLKPILYFEQSSATLHLYRYNIAHLKLDAQTVREIIQDELSFLYRHSKTTTAQA